MAVKTGGERERERERERFYTVVIQEMDGLFSISYCCYMPTVVIRNIAQNLESNDKILRLLQ